MSNAVKFIPAKNVIPWDRASRNLPYGDGLYPWIHKNYFEMLDKDIKEAFDKIPSQTPVGNGFSFSIVVDVQKEPWNDIEWASVNYVMSDMKIRKDQKGYSYFHITNYTPKYLNDGRVFVSYDIELDDYTTFYYEIANNFKGKLQMTQGHKHEWLEVDGGYIPDFQNNQGLSLCDEVCKDLNTEIVKSELTPVYGKDGFKDYYVLFFSTGRGDWTKGWTSFKSSKWYDNIYSNREGSENIYGSFNFNSSSFSYSSKNVKPYTIPYYVMFVEKTDISAKELNGIIDNMGITPLAGEGAMGLWAKLNNNQKLSDGMGVQIEANNTVWNGLGKTLKDKYKGVGFGKDEILPFSFGGNMKIENIQVISIKNINDICDKSTIVIPVNSNNFLHNFAGKASLVIPDIATIDVYIPKQIDIKMNEHYSLTINSDGYWDTIRDRTPKGLNVELQDEHIKQEPKIYSKNEIIKEKIKPHLRTINHEKDVYVINNGSTFEIDDREMYLSKDDKRGVNVYAKPFINIDKLGYDYTFTPSYLNENVNIFNKDSKLTTIDIKGIPYGENTYNDFMRSNINSVQTGKDNAKANFELQKKVAKRNYAQQMFSSIANGVVGMANGAAQAITGGITAMLPGGLAGGIGNAVAGKGQMASSAVNMAGGIWKAVNEKKNAIDTARTKEQNTLRSINAKVSDARNGVQNVNNAGSADTLLMLQNGEFNNGNVDTLYKYEVSIPDNQKELLWYMRNTYGDGFSKTYDIKSLDDLMVMKYFTYMRLSNIEGIVGKLKVPTAVKDTIQTTLESGVAFWNIKYLNKDSIFDYRVNNYDTILLDDNDKKYSFNYEFDKVVYGGKKDE